MKTIDKMTDQEIYDLTDEQIDRLIITRCAKEGVRFVGEPPVMKAYDYKPISPSNFFYLLEGLSIAVFNQDDAIKIAKFLRSLIYTRLHTISLYPMRRYIISWI